MEKGAEPATVIQADAATFKDLVQKLTGAPHKLRPKATVARWPSFKLHERRKQSLRDIEVGVESNGKTRGNTGFSPVMGPSTPAEEEERAIAEKGFYLHASPPKAEPPVLLTLFPLISPNSDT